MIADWCAVPINAPALPASARTFAPPVLAALTSATYFDYSLIPGYAEAKLLPLAPANTPGR